jgi:hypothetical protein
MEVMVLGCGWKVIQTTKKCFEEKNALPLYSREDACP